MRIKSERDFLSGLVFIVVGAAFAIGANNYKVGDAARMGPGYFPTLLGILLAIVGVVVVFLALTVETEDGEKFGKMAWKPLFFIILANLVFGVLLGGLPKLGIPAFGLIIAIYALVFIAAMAGDEFKFKEVIILASILAVMSYFAFVYMLNLQFQVWPTFLTR